MPYDKEVLAHLLPSSDFGNSVAENDNVLNSVRVDTSVFADLLEDRVDLIPGTKGSGKSALFRIFTDFLPSYLLESKKIVVAHGVHSHGDLVFRAFEDVFGRLTENDFVDFWCIYLVRIAHTDFVTNPTLQQYLSAARKEISEFEKLCSETGIPSAKPHRSFRELLESVLSVLALFIPTVEIDAKEAKFEINPAGNMKAGAASRPKEPPVNLPRYVDQLKILLDEILRKSNLRLWLMIDRLDEIFPRRSEVETRALRALLRTMQDFGTKRIPLKLFLRDDILSQVTTGGRGFTALTHITSRQADKLRWSEDQILTLIVNRLFLTNSPLSGFLKINEKSLKSDAQYRTLSFYRVFPETMPDGTPTLKWIYEHTMDGQGVVTPRDIIDLLTRAKQKQQDEFNSDSNGTVDWIIGPSAIEYGFAELGRRKKDTLLRAEYDHLWQYISLFEHGKTYYTRKRIMAMFGKGGPRIIDDLVSIGFLSPNRIHLHGMCYQIPHVYRKCLGITDGLER